MSATIHQFPNREPTRRDDERLLQACLEAETMGLVVMDEDLLGDRCLGSDVQEAGDAGDREGQDRVDMRFVSSPAPFVSLYLQRPLRSEAQVRKQLNRPHPIFEAILSGWRS